MSRNFQNIDAKSIIIRSDNFVDQNAVTKKYVDDLLLQKTVKCITPTNIFPVVDVSTQQNVTTLTSKVNGGISYDSSLFDGVNLALNDRVLVSNYLKRDVTTSTSSTISYASAKTISYPSNDSATFFDDLSCWPKSPVTAGNLTLSGTLSSTSSVVIKAELRYMNQSYAETPYITLNSSTNFGVAPGSFTVNYNFSQDDLDIINYQYGRGYEAADRKLKLIITVVNGPTSFGLIMESADIAFTYTQPFISPYNGIYKVTSVGGSTTKWSLTRSDDFNATGKVKSGVLVTVNDGTWKGSSWILATPAPIVLDISPLEFLQHDSMGYVNYYAGTTTIRSTLDASTTSLDTGAMVIQGGMSVQKNLNSSGLTVQNNATIKGRLVLNNGYSENTRTVYSDTYLDNTYYFVQVDASAGPVTMYLPNSALYTGSIYKIIKKDSSSNEVIVRPAPTDYLNGVLGDTIVLHDQYDHCIINCAAGLKWVVV